MNWSMWAPGAFDYSADKVGLTYGATAELNQKQWALRAGYFLMAVGIELEQFRHPVFKTRRRTCSNWRRATRCSTSPASCAPSAGSTAPTPAATATTLNNPALESRHRADPHAAASNTASTSTPSSRSPRTSGCSPARAGTTGRTEILSFTDIDRSVSGGLSVKGSYWGRPSDTIGIGGAVNGLSAAHIAISSPPAGSACLIGDGRLNYGHERIFETYYAYALDKSFTLTADYQFITNPAYNADRGPVHIFSGRLHGEF